MYFILLILLLMILWKLVLYDKFIRYLFVYCVKLMYVLINILCIYMCGLYVFIVVSYSDFFVNIVISGVILN